MTAPFFDGTQACAGEDPELFFPSLGGTATQAVAQAKAICARCRFRQPCLDDALTAKAGSYYVSGVLGGTTTAERDRIRRDQRQQAAA